MWRRTTKTVAGGQGQHASDCTAAAEGADVEGAPSSNQPSPMALLGDIGFVARPACSLAAGLVTATPTGSRSWPAIHAAGASRAERKGRVEG